MPHAGAARARRRGHPLPSPASRAAAPLGHPPAEAGAPVPPAGARIINPSLALTEYRPRAADPRATVYPSRLAHLAPSSLVTSPEAEPDPAPPVSPSENTHARQDTRCLAHSKHNSVARSRPHPQSSTSLVSSHSRRTPRATVFGQASGCRSTPRPWPRPLCGRWLTGLRPVRRYRRVFRAGDAHVDVGHIFPRVAHGLDRRAAARAAVGGRRVRYRDSRNTGGRGAPRIFEFNTRRVADRRPSRRLGIRPPARHGARAPSHRPRDSAVCSREAGCRLDGRRTSRPHWCRRW